MSTNPKKKISREWFEITITEHYKWLANNTKGKQAYFTDTEFKNVTFSDINLNNCIFYNCNFVNCKFTNVNLSNSGINCCNFNGVLFEKSDINNTHFVCCDFNKLLIEKSNISECLFKSGKFLNTFLVDNINFRTSFKDSFFDRKIEEVSNANTSRIEVRLSKPALKLLLYLNDMNKGDEDEDEYNDL